MYAQIDFHRESDKQLYARIFFYNPGFIRMISGRATSFTEFSDRMTIELSNLVRENFITEEQSDKIQSALADLYQVCGYVYVCDLHILGEELEAVSVTETYTLVAMDDDEREECGAFAHSIRQFAVDVQI